MFKRGAFAKGGGHGPTCKTCKDAVRRDCLHGTGRRAGGAVRPWCDAERLSLAACHRPRRRQAPLHCHRSDGAWRDQDIGRPGRVLHRPGRDDGGVLRQPGARPGRPGRQRQWRRHRPDFRRPPSRPPSDLDADQLRRARQLAAESGRAFVERRDAGPSGRNRPAVPERRRCGPRRICQRLRASRARFSRDLPDLSRTALRRSASHPEPRALVRLVTRLQPDRRDRAAAAPTRSTDPDRLGYRGHLLPGQVGLLVARCEFPAPARSSNWRAPSCSSPRSVPKSSRRLCARIGNGSSSWQTPSRHRS